MTSSKSALVALMVTWWYLGNGGESPLFRGVVMVTATEGETRDYCQLETFYAACGGGGGSDVIDNKHGNGGSDDSDDERRQLRVISMRTARYGRMRVDGRCVKRDYGYIGCASDVLGHVDRLCSGKRVCDFAVAELHGNQPCPNDLTPYLEAAYDCIPVITEPTQRCSIDGSRTPIVIRSRSSGYLASSVTMDTGRGGPSCPWSIQVPEGQLINITLVNFARVGLPTDWGSASGVVAQVPAASQPAISSSTGTVHSQSAAAAAARPKVCYQLADIREAPAAHTTPTATGSSVGAGSVGVEGTTVRTVTECEGSLRLNNVYTSTTNSIVVEVIVAKILNVHFLLHFKAIGCANPVFPTGAIWRREGDEVWVRCNTSADFQWRMRCDGSDWRHVPLTVGGLITSPVTVNCSLHSHVSSSSSSASASFSDSASGSGSSSSGSLLSWDIGHLFATDAFPLSILLVVAVGVAMGVFVGGVLLVFAARYVRRRRRQQMREDEEDDYALTHHLHHHHQFQQLSTPPHQLSPGHAYLQLGGKTTVLPTSAATTCDDTTTTTMATPETRDSVLTSTPECIYCTTVDGTSVTLRRPCTNRQHSPTRSARLCPQHLSDSMGEGNVTSFGGPWTHNSGTATLPRTGGAEQTLCGRCGHKHRTDPVAFNNSSSASPTRPSIILIGDELSPQQLQQQQQFQAETAECIISQTSSNI